MPLWTSIAPYRITNGFVVVIIRTVSHGVSARILFITWKNGDVLLRLMTQLDMSGFSVIGLVHFKLWDLNQLSNLIMLHNKWKQILHQSNKNFNPSWITKFWIQRMKINLIGGHVLITMKYQVSPELHTLNLWTFLIIDNEN